MDTKKKNIKESSIQDALFEIGGELAYKLYKVLKGKENVDELIIADKLKISLNSLRNLIYKFDQYNLLSSTRKKDRKKGWYIYYFTLNQRYIEDLIVKLKDEKIKKLEKKLEREELHEFYKCVNKCIRMNIENAMETNFMCPECGSLLELEDQEKNIIKLKKSIEELKA
ncbi:hypothetical protein J4216_00890 [Candidatus Woesearchaeota archaeon]|nr:hypothetical protein [Candidatus Woesearchaeota archaeon]